MTTLAVLADIHGNSIALEAVLNDLDSQGGIDHTIVLGDLAVFGPDPVGVLALLKKHEPIFYVCGNTDRYLVEGRYPTGSGKQNWEPQVLASFPWTVRRLGRSGLRVLTCLPQRQLLYFSEEHAVMAVHGSPRSDEENICPDTSDEDLCQMLTEGLSYNLLLCGHTHMQVNRVLNGRRIVNGGSVGLPFDGFPGASYALVHLQPGGNCLVEFRRVAYDIETVVKQLFDVGHPAAAIQAYNLRMAQPLSESLIYTEETQQRRIVPVYKPETPSHKLRARITMAFGLMT